MKTATFKFNGGLGALLCENCAVIIKTGKDYTPQEKEASIGEITMPPQYCNKCRIKLGLPTMDSEKDK